MELRRAECARPGSDRERTRAGGVRNSGSYSGKRGARVGLWY